MSDDTMTPTQASLIARIDERTQLLLSAFQQFQTTIQVQLSQHRSDLENKINAESEERKKAITAEAVAREKAISALDDDKVGSDAFKPIKLFVYGIFTLLGLGVFGSILKLVIIGA